MEDDGHPEHRAAILERGRQTLPLALQPARLHTNHVGRVVARVAHALRHPQDAGDVHVHILSTSEKQPHCYNKTSHKGEFFLDALFAGFKVYSLALFCSHWAK